jgi:hypothetical protein
MKTAFAPRASAILYSLLTSRADRRPFLVPANICPVVLLTFIKANRPFDLVDISRETLHMDLDVAESHLKTGRYGGLLYAHTYGDESTPSAFFAHVIQRDTSTLIIDDRCLCRPEIDANPARGAHVSLYSTGYAKIVDLGFGGYAYCADPVPYQSAHLPYDALARNALEQTYKQTVLRQQEYRYRDSNWLETDRPLPTWEEYMRQISDALLRSLAHRQAINKVYHHRLPAEITLPAAYQTWRFNILVHDKHRILQALFAAGLFASSHYASLVGIFASGDCPQAKKLSTQVINLFNDHHYTQEMAEEACRIILKSL